MQVAVYVQAPPRQFHGVHLRMAQDGLCDLKHTAETAEGIPRRPVEIIVPSMRHVTPSSRPAMATFCGPNQKSPEVPDRVLGPQRSSGGLAPRRAFRWWRTDGTA
jgi:hypothetical protein